MSEKFDIIIIGAGPAGISAGLYAKRSGANVLVLYHGETNLDYAKKIDNYYGFAQGIEGRELYENGIKQAINLGIEVKKEEVLHIEKNEDFMVKTSKSEYCSKSVIIATGNKKLKPKIKGIQQFEGKGVSYCAICDGFFYKNRNVVVIGNGEFAINEANHLQNIANSVKILTNGEELNAVSTFETNKCKIKQIIGDEKVKKIEFEDGTQLDVDGIFIAIGEAGGVDFAKKMGVILDKDNIKVDENMMTNIDGLYSCGDVTGGLFQVCKAVYDGAKAGLDAAKRLRK